MAQCCFVTATLDWGWTNSYRQHWTEGGLTVTDNTGLRLDYQLQTTLDWGWTTSYRQHWTEAGLPVTDNTGLRLDYQLQTTLDWGWTTSYRQHWTEGGLPVTDNTILMCTWNCKTKVCVFFVWFQFPSSSGDSFLYRWSDHLPSSVKTDMATRPHKGCLLISADGQEVVTWSLHFHNAQRPVWLCGCELSWSFALSQCTETSLAMWLWTLSVSGFGRAGHCGNCCAIPSSLARTATNHH